MGSCMGILLPCRNPVAGSNSEGIPAERCNQLGPSMEGSGVVNALGRQGGCQDQ